MEEVFPYWQDPGLLFSLAMVMVFGCATFLMWRFPPRQINPLYGYRTRRAALSEAHWQLAQKYSGKLLGYLCLSFFLYPLLRSFWSCPAYLGLSLVLAQLVFAPLWLYWQTEKKLAQLE